MEVIILYCCVLGEILIDQGAGECPINFCNWAYPTIKNPPKTVHHNAKLMCSKGCRLLVFLSTLRNIPELIAAKLPPSQKK